MSGHLIAVTTVIYTYVCIEQFIRGNLPMGLAYAGYAFANIGLFLAVSK